MVKPLDVATLSATFTISPESGAGLTEILRRTGDLVPLAGEGAGWHAFRPHERQELVDEDRCLRKHESPEEAKRRADHFAKSGREPAPPDIVKYRMFEDRLVPNTVARIETLHRLIAIEDEGPNTDINDPATCGFRAWVKHHGVTGVVFKKVWDSTDTVDHDPLWFYESLGNDSYDWD